MAKQKQEEAPKGSPAWMATFSDLMNLLLCFFVLLFSMSSVQEEKFQEVIASLQSSFSILPSGGPTIGEGEMISSGISNLEMFDDYFNSVNEGQDNEFEKEGTTDYQGQMDAISEEAAAQILEQAALSESEKMAQEVEENLDKLGLSGQVEVDFNASYVVITMNGSLLFDSGESELRPEAMELVDKLTKAIEGYSNNIIEIEGHTDSVPIHTSKYEDNNVLSMYRALTVADHIRDVSDIPDANVKSAGRGEYVPVADNSTSEGRARNRRVEIKIYNSYNSEGAL
ncbi:MAG: flagellar motor protein MotB [Pseudobutyrivibrio sp.]|nr:flagellar motor protein MotB [Pseudobutyrivibrio sp.]